jgi:hypothetical protein
MHVSGGQLAPGSEYFLHNTDYTTCHAAIWRFVDISPSFHGVADQSTFRAPCFTQLWYGRCHTKDVLGAFEKSPDHSSSSGVGANLA